MRTDAANILVTMFTFFLFLIIYIMGDTPMAEAKDHGWFQIPRHKNAGLYEPWECALEKDNVPVLDSKAELLFLEARELQTSKPYLSDSDKAQIFAKYSEATKLNHWRAMVNLANCYINGVGTPPSITRANAIYDQMMEKGIPAGFYGKYAMVLHGRGVKADKDNAQELLHKAADLGHPTAQYELGRYYLNIEHRPKQGLRYLICALRQGHGEAGYDIAFYLVLMENNYTMAAEYYWRAAALGNTNAIIALNEAFAESSQSDGDRTTLGFPPDRELSKRFDDRWTVLSKNPRAKFPDLFTEEPIPDNPSMSRQQGRAAQSQLRLDDGCWPDEVFPELAPGYVVPRY